jgi:integrase
MCSLAETWGLRPPGTNPVRGIARYRERQLERYLSPEELARLGAVLQHAAAQRTEHPSVLACVWLLLYTGARLGEVLGLQWSMLDWQAGVARLPDSKTGAKTLYLPPPALALLQALPRPEGVPWRLPSRRHGQPLSNPHKPWYRLTAQAGLPGVRLHDLRHTWVSLGLRTGVGLDLLGKAVGHQHVATTQRYAHLAEDPLWQVAAQVGIAVQTALTGGPVAAGH